MKKKLFVLVLSLTLLPLVVKSQCGTNLSATDADGYVYPSLQVGPHCWLQTNLKTMAPGGLVYYSDMYPDIAANLDIYGRLYNWETAVQNPIEVGEHGFVRGVCPVDWHIPTESEVLELTSNIAPAVHATTKWLTPGTNTTQYTQMPGGFYNARTKRYENLCGEAYFWSIGKNQAPVEVWSDCHCDMFLLNSGKVQNGLSVRCVHNVYRAEVQTDSSSIIDETTAVLHGTVAFAGYDDDYERGFQWGNVLSHLENIKVENPNAQVEGSYSVTLEGLTPTETYYYRAYVVNDFDTTFGAMMSFTLLVDPIVTTKNVADVQTKAATLHASMTNLSNVPVVETGFLYSSVNAIPTFADTKVLVSDAAANSYSKQVSNLLPNTLYYVRAYLITEDDDTLCADNVKDFTTLIIPADTTKEITDVQTKVATFYASMTNPSNVPVVERGFLYSSVNAIPTFADTKVLASNAAADNYSQQVANLSPNTSYYVRAYVITEFRDTVCAANVKNFTTLIIPADTTKEITDIQTKAATFHASMTNPSNVPVFERGFLYSSVNAIPTFADTKVLVSDAAADNYSQQITNLSPNTSYYVRAYEITEFRDTVCAANVKSFTTLIMPTDTTKEITDIRYQSAIFHASINNPSNVPFVETGFLYSVENEVPTFADTKVLVSDAAANNYSKQVVELSPNTSYYVRAYVITEFRDTVYAANVKDFTTLIMPTDTTKECTDIQNQTVTFHAAFANPSNVPLVEKGFLYSTENEVPTFADTKVLGEDDGLETNTYSKVVMNLNRDAKNYVRAYIITMYNDTVYAGNVQFVVGKHKVLTDEAKNVKANHADLYGTVVCLGEADSTNVGFKYGTEKNILEHTQIFGEKITSPQEFQCGINALSLHTTYYYVAYSATQTDTVYGDTLNFTTYDNECVVDHIRDNEIGVENVVDSVKDFEGNVYKVIKINNLCWMTENLRSTKNMYGENISGRYAPANVASNVPQYGYMYSWNSALNACPKGWRLSSDEDWFDLFPYDSSEEPFLSDGEQLDWLDLLRLLELLFGGNNNTGYLGEGVARLVGGNAWETLDDSLINHRGQPGDYEFEYRNSTGFNALPAGCVWYGSSSYGMHKDAYFWTSTESQTGVWIRRINYENEGLRRNANNTDDYCFSVRCVRDFCVDETSTDSICELTKDSVVLCGSVKELCQNEASVHVGFKYGIKDSLMHIKMIDNLVSEPCTFRIMVKDLVPNKVYYYSTFMVYENAQDTIWGNTKYFVTNNNPCRVANIMDNEVGANNYIDSLKDYEGNVYKVVQIGNQCWMAENLRSTMDKNGHSISSYCDPDNKSVNVAKFGRLYMWNTDLCPQGWHLPSDAEWFTLYPYDTLDVIGYFGNSAAQLVSGADWIGKGELGRPNNYDYEERNITGFSALPAGLSGSGVFFSGFGADAYFWSSTTATGSPLIRRITNVRDGVSREKGNASVYLCSVRCLRNKND